MQKPTDKEIKIKEEFSSPRGLGRQLIVLLALSAGGAVVFLFIQFDPLGLLNGPPPVHHAKKWIAICVCFMWVPLLSGVWFMMVGPLRTGITTSLGTKNQPPRIVLRSEGPQRFRAEIWTNGVVLAIVLASSVYVLADLIRDLRKADANPEAVGSGVPVHAEGRNLSPNPVR